MNRQAFTQTDVRFYNDLLISAILADREIAFEQTQPDCSELHKAMTPADIGAIKEIVEAFKATNDFDAFACAVLELCSDRAGQYKTDWLKGHIREAGWYAIYVPDRYKVESYKLQYKSAETEALAKQRDKNPLPYPERMYHYDLTELLESNWKLGWPWTVACTHRHSSTYLDGSPLKPGDIGA